MKDILKVCQGLDMTNTTNVANFLVDIANSLRVIKIVMVDLPGEDMIKVTCFYYQSISGTPGLRYVEQDVAIALTTTTTAANVADLVARVKARLDRQVNMKVGLSYINPWLLVTNHNQSTGTLRLAGPCLKRYLVSIQTWMIIKQRVDM